MQCTACTHEGTRCANTVNLLLRNLPRDVQRDLRDALTHRCRVSACCQVCTTHAKEAFRVRYGPMLLAKGFDVAQMTFTTMLELLSCQVLNLDSSACEELWSESQGIAKRWGM